jgi:hypothetical protein
VRGRTRSAVVGGALFGFAACLPGGLASAAAVPHSVLTIDSTNGGAGTGGLDTTLDETNAKVFENTFAKSPAQGEMFSLIFQGPDIAPNQPAQTYATVEAVPDQNLQVGTFPVDDDVNHPRTVLLWTAGTHGWVCFNTRGSVVISEVGRDGTGALTSFAASYSLTCDDTGMVGYKASGYVLWNSTQPYVAVDAPSRVDFNRIPVGTMSGPMTARVTNVGTAPLALGAPVIGGTDAGSFTKVSDGCANKTIAPHSSCDVVLTAAVVTTAELTATLTIPDSSPQGERLVLLKAAGLNPPTSFAATPTQGSVHLAFSLVDSSALEFAAYDPADRFVIMRGTSAANLAQIGYTVIESPQYDDATVVPGVSYVYQVWTLSQAGEQAASAVSAPVVSWPTTGAGRFWPNPPFRVMDTRHGVGVARSPIGPGGTIALPITGHGYVPVAGAQSVVLNVTAVLPTADTYLTIFPAGTARPAVSNLNLRRGEIRANLVTVPIGPGGLVDIYNRAGSVNVVGDEVGYYTSSTARDSAAAGQFHPITPTRVIDTRVAGQRALPSHFAYLQAVDFYGSTTNYSVQALAVNVTVVAPATTGYVTTWDGSSALPIASTLDFAAHQTVANLAIVPVGRCDLTTACMQDRLFGVYNGSAGALHLVVDVVGFYDNNTLPGGLRFHSTTPVRIMDTRIAQGAPSPLGPGGQATITVPPAQVDALTAGVVLNVTAVGPTAPTAVTVWPAGAPQPLASNLNVPAGRTLANAVMTGVGALGTFDVYNSAGTTDLLADLAGTFEAWQLPVSNPGPRAVMTDRFGVRSAGSSMRLH